MLILSNIVSLIKLSLSISDPVAPYFLRQRTLELEFCSGMLMIIYGPTKETTMASADIGTPST